MTISMHSVTVPVFTAQLEAMSAWLGKASAHAEAKKFDPQVLLSVRLAPDMFPLAKQVQIACDTAKFCVARLSGGTGPTFDDSETTLEQLQQRIAATVAYVQSVPASALDGTEAQTITMQRRGSDVRYDGETYAKHFALPNFFFHVTTTYALLRHNGIALGKHEFLGLQGRGA